MTNTIHGEPTAKTPNPKNYDLDFRPKAYWGPQDVNPSAGRLKPGASSETNRDKR